MSLVNWAPTLLKEEAGHEFHGNQYDGAGAHLRDLVEPHTASGGTYSDAGKNTFAVELSGDRQAHLYIDEDVKGAERPTTAQIQTLLSTVADLHEKYGQHSPPSISVVSRATLASYAQDHPELKNARAWSMPNGVYGFNVVGRQAFRADTSRTFSMPSAREMGQVRSVAAHEYGHIHDYDRHNAGPNRQAMYQAVMEMPKSGGLSRYGQTSAREAYAELFSEHVLHPGSDIPAVKTFAEAYGW